MDFMTREVFDWLVVIVIISGGILAYLRLRRDLTGPPRDFGTAQYDETHADDTRPNIYAPSGENHDTGRRDANEHAYNRGSSDDSAADAPD